MDTDERYEIIDDNHAKGGFGKISKQRDRFLDRIVAVKKLHMFADPESKGRFEREAKALARMSHPNVPAIYDVKFGKGEMFIYFEFVEGETLRKKIADGAVPSMEQARRWFMQVAAALDHAHVAGIIHRDVKPENIVISADDMSAVLVDFGIALNSDDVKRITAEGYAVGTPGYMSPEHVNGEELDGRSDLYSLGITLYETLCSHLPHPGAYQSLSDNNEAIPPAVDALIKSCLAQDRKLRVESAKDFISKLRNALRSDVPLSSLLTEARLHELVAALYQLSPEDFHTKPLGQRLLIINRLKDLMRTDQRQLRQATAEMIALILRLAMFEAATEYAPIVKAAFDWGFDKFYGDRWQGSQEVRESLIHTAKVADKEAHRALATSFLAFADPASLEQKPRWYVHDLRLIVMSLLANPKCGEEAQDLAVAYDRINEITHVEEEEIGRSASVRASPAPLAKLTSA